MNIAEEWSEWMNNSGIIGKPPFWHSVFLAGTMDQVCREFNLEIKIQATAVKKKTYME